MHLLNILQSIPRFALCSSISVQAAPLGRNKVFDFTSKVFDFTYLFKFMLPYMDITFI